MSTPETTDMPWLFQKIECGYEFLGGYRYLDQCGEILRNAQQGMGYIVNNVDSSKAVVSKNSDNFVAEFSCISFSLTQDEPEDSGELLLDELLAWHPVIWGNINPISLEKNKIIFDFSFPVASEQEVFERLAGIDIPLFDKLSDAMAMPKLMQNLTFMFKSGSTIAECTLMGRGFTTPVPSRNHVNFFATEGQRNLNSKVYSRKSKAAGNEYSWAVDLRIIVSEEQPVFPEKRNDWAIDRTRRLFDFAWEMRRKVKGIIRL